MSLLREIFPSGESASSYADTLIQLSRTAPRTFSKQWENTRTSISGDVGDPNRAIRLLARLVGWSIFEAFWNDPESTSFAIHGEAAVKLAAISFGMSHELSKDEILNIFFAQKELFSGLMVERFEKGVGAGLKEISNAEKKINDQISNWEKKIEATEQLANTAESKIASYEASLSKYKVAFGFLGLTAAFKEFFKRKENENKKWGIAAAALGLSMFIIASSSHYIANMISQETKQLVLQNQKTNIVSSNDVAAIQEASKDANKSTKDISKRVDQPTAEVINAQQENYENREFEWAGKYMPVAVIEILLLYFFRISLVHFNSTKAQLLQLEVRMAVCGFIEDYAKFTKENKDQDLSKFESMIFSSIASVEEKIPSTFDGMDQLSELIKSARGKT